MTSEFRLEPPPPHPATSAQRRSRCSADACAYSRAFAASGDRADRCAQPAPIPTFAASFFVLFSADLVNPSVCSRTCWPSDVFSRTNSSASVASPSNFSAFIGLRHTAFHPSSLFLR